MISFEDKVDFLRRMGWTERSPMSFVKNDREIFWDTSSAVEIYPANDKNKRLEDVRIETLEDLEKLVKRLEQI
jgi:hypothetical protein